MSPERERPAAFRQRRWPWLLLALLGVAALAAWALPIRYVRGLEVEMVRLLAPGEPDGSTKPAALSTPRRIAVTFSTPYDLEAMRADEGLGLVYATLAACDGEGATSELVTQGAEYRRDDRRVRRLPSRDGRSRYRAVFNDELTYRVDHQARRKPAIGTPGGLCFSLGGGSMFIGAAWSSKIPINLSDA